MKTPLALVVAVAGTLGFGGHFALAQELKDASASLRFGAVEFRQWQQDQPPLKLIRKDEGFCALTGVTGNFEGGGEQVHVYVGDDGYWYLGGKSAQEGVSAECMVVRYPAPLKPAIDESVVILAASYSFGSQYADVTARVRELLKGDGTFQANPWCLLADPQPGWNKALVVFCEVRSKQAIFSVGEGENVSRSLILERARMVSPGNRASD